MGKEQLKTPEERTRVFFDRSSDAVVDELSSRIYSAREGERPEIVKGKGKGKELTVFTSEGEKIYKITLAQAYLETDAIRVWKGKRMQQIKLLAPGEVVGYNSRAGKLTFIKTRGAENIQIRELTEIGTDKKTKNSTEVTEMLGLSHGEEGRLTFVDENRLRFEKI